MSFTTALSGLNAAAADLATTANNIANVGTTGFKRSRAEFADIYASAFHSVTSNTPGSGVKVADIDQIFTQGNVELTGNNLDLAINGEGFFVLSNDGVQKYTRAGMFGADRDGYVVNSFGERLQAYPPVQTGSLTAFNTGALSDLRLSTTESPPKATGSVTAGLNLSAGQVAPALAFDPSQADTFNHSTSLALYDSQGGQHTGTLYFVSDYDGVDTATANRWQTYLFVDGENVSTDGNGAVTAPSYESVELTFNPDGSLASAGGDPNGQFSFDSFSTTLAGADPLALNFDFSESTQFGGAFGVNELSQDGYAKGLLAGLDVSAEGIVSARFSNGQTQAMGQVAMAKFNNQQGLIPLGDNSWAESFASGNPVLGTAGSSNFGTMQAGALEASNVDLSEQLVRMIVAQRNYQANAESISTEDSITQTILNIR